MKHSLQTRLSLSYIMVALISILLISVLTNIFLEQYFKDYIKKNQESKNSKIISMLSQYYELDGKWNLGNVDTIGVNALENGIIIKVRDIHEKIIWDATVHNNGMCQRIIMQMSENMQMGYPEINGIYEEVRHNILLKNKVIGSVSIGIYGPFSFSENDILFLNTLNKLLLIVGGISLVLALITAGIMAKRISNPILKVIDTAKMISKGNYKNRVSEQIKTNEIRDLAITINELGKSLQKQENLRKRITGDVAHELRTPLTTLQSHLEAMIDGIWEVDKTRLESCHDEIIRITKIVGDLEELARYESENLLLNISEFDVADLIQQIIYQLEPKFIEKEVNINFDRKKCLINADKDKVSQVLINILSNSIKYTNEKGTVTVEVKVEENQKRISIIDTGIGIPESDVPLIFERFYRVDKSRNRESGGTGIGLAIVNGIVNAHNWKIEVESRVDVGTKFSIIIPNTQAV